MNRVITAGQIARSIADDWINGNRSDALAAIDALTDPRMLALVSILVISILDATEGASFINALAS